jgi:hypothetical protein
VRRWKEVGRRMRWEGDKEEDEGVGRRMRRWGGGEKEIGRRGGKEDEEVGRRVRKWERGCMRRWEGG